MAHMQQVGSVYIARSAIVEGDVTLGDETNIWHQCVLRGDVAPIRLGRRVNVQDGTILHCNKDVPLVIDDHVAIGHNAVVHCKHVGSHTLIASKAIVLDDAVIGEHCLIAAGALVPPETEIPPGSVVMGVPGKVARPIRDEEKDYIQRVLDIYVDLARQHAAGMYPEYGAE